MSVNAYIYALENPEVQCGIHNGSPKIHILSLVNPIPRIDTHFFKLYFKLSSHLHLGLPIGLFPVGLPVKILQFYYAKMYIETRIIEFKN